MSMLSGDIYSDEKNFQMTSSYICLNSSFPNDILIEAPFSQLSIVYNSEQNVVVCLCDLFNLSSYEFVDVGSCN